MKLRKTLTTVVLGLGLSALAVAASAAPDDKHADKKSGDRFERMAKHLELTAEQKAQLQPLHEQRRAAMQERRRNMQELHKNMQSAWTADAVDEQKLETLRQEQVRQFDADSKAQLQHRLAVAKVLTPAQRQKMQERMAKRNRQGMMAGAKKRGHGEGHVRGQKPATK